MDYITFNKLFSKYSNYNEDDFNKINTHSLDKILCVDGNYYKIKEIRKLKTSISQGEKIIMNLLEYNNIFYDTQYKIYIKGNLHYFDFYLPNENLIIEYDGEQHFDSVSIWGGETGLTTRQQRDIDKDDWCKLNGIEIIRIPYKIQSESEMAEILGRYTKIALNESLIKQNKDIAEYYIKNTAQETGAHFNITQSKVKNIFHGVYGISKAYYLAKNTDIDYRSLAGALAGKRGDNGKNQKWLKSLTDEQLTSMKDDLSSRKVKPAEFEGKYGKTKEQVRNIEVD